MMTATAASTQAPATAGNLIEWLLRDGFAREAGRPWFRKGMTRVVIDDEEGFFTVYRFDDAYPKADMLAWDVRFSCAPLAVITATIKAA